MYGRGKLITDGEIRNVAPGDVVKIPSGMKHAIEAETKLHIIEVQLGENLTEEDITRLDWKW